MKTRSLLVHLLPIVLTLGITGLGLALPRIDKIIHKGKGLIKSKSLVDAMLEQDDYVLGRTVLAKTFSKNRASLDREKLFDIREPLVSDPEATRYVSMIGSAVALHSSRPQLFHGYCFGILNSAEINACSSPGGHVVVTLGLLLLCRSEDEVAAVLAHEVAHVALRHGVRSLDKSGLLSDIRDVAIDVGNLAGADTRDVAKVANGFSGKLFDTLLDKGYDRDFEYEADREAVRILERTGYDPLALVRVLGYLEQSGQSKEVPGLARSHPSPRDRIKKLQSMIAGTPPRDSSSARTRRFESEFAALRAG